MRGHRPSSQRYDKSTHDRLQAAATSYVEKYALSFGGALAPSEWSLVEGEGRYVFSACGEGDKHRPFETILAWHDCFRPGAKLKFPTVPVRRSPVCYTIVWRETVYTHVPSRVRGAVSPL